MLAALLRKNGIPDDQVQKVIIGSDMTPLLTGPGRRGDRLDHQHDRASRFLVRDYIALRLWDCGVRLYALPYYATTDTLTQKADVLAGFLRAAGRGWAYAKANPEKAVDLLLQEYPNLVRADELVLPRRSMFDVEFTVRTKEHGWGSFDPAVWEAQIDQYDELKQFPAGKPKLDQVMTTKILDMTENDRPKIG